MSHTRLWTAATIIAFVVVIGFVLSVPHTRDIPISSESKDAATDLPPVTLHDVFKKGVHTITGSILAPNACSIVSADAVLAHMASGTQNIQVMLSLSEDAGVCLQLPTATNFSVTITAPAHLPITATVNGTAAVTSML